ncbi:unnamed protein product [Durusdinium trenchii]|uniref:proline--tRNA ligase n=2 Tax=Durusdinium trenchii TaxID=1381693 RepID=A0ABP0JTB4_9DINO
MLKKITFCFFMELLLVLCVSEAHSDDGGLIMPPALAAIQVVILPLYAKDPQQQASVLDAAAALRKDLTAVGMRVHIDDRLSMKPGAKYFEWERRGVPLRLELGMRDLEKGIALGKLRTGGEKFEVPLEDPSNKVSRALTDMKSELKSRSEQLKQRLIFRIESRSDFNKRLKEDEPGMMLVPWGGDDDDEDSIKEETGVTLRCYPLDQDELPDEQDCPLTGKPSRRWAIFAKAY